MSRTATRLILSLLAAAAIAGCGTMKPDKEAGDQTITPTAQFPLEARAHPDEIRIAVHPGGLSPAQVDALSDLANRWLDAGGGMVTIQEPAKDADPRAVARNGAAARSLMLSMGVPADRVQLVSYDPAEDGPAPLVVGYAAYQAVVPSCGHAWENLSDTKKNKAMGNFGCAVAANMAVQIANPADIAAPRDAAAGDAARREVVLGKYRTGDVTTTAKDAQASGAVSASGGSN